MFCKAFEQAMVLYFSKVVTKIKAVLLVFAFSTWLRIICEPFSSHPGLSSRMIWG